MEFRIETSDTIRFVKLYMAAFQALSLVAERGSDEEHAAAAEIAPYRSFFPDPSSGAQSARILDAWRKLSPRRHALDDRSARWDIQNMLYMLGPGMRTWRHVGFQIVGPTLVLLTIEETEHPSATGVIRQIVECAGGRIIEREGRWPWVSILGRRAR